MAIHRSLLVGVTGTFFLFAFRWMTRLVDAATVHVFSNGLHREGPPSAQRISGDEAA
jgi:hypothetical protein